MRQWCSDVLTRADFPLTNASVHTSVGRVHLTSAGAGRPRIILVPGTGFNAAVALPWLQKLSTRWPTTVVDLPGQPRLSDPRRPRRSRLAWYGRVLDEILGTIDATDVVVVGNSLGAAVASAAEFASNHGAGPRLARWFHTAQCGSESGAGISRLVASTHGRTHGACSGCSSPPEAEPPEAEVGMDDLDGRVLSHDPGTSTPAR